MLVTLYTHVVNYNFTGVLIKNNTDKSIKLLKKLRLGTI